MKKTKSYRSLVAKINWHIKENSWANTTVDKWCVGVTDKPLRGKSDYQRELGMDVRNCVFVVSINGYLFFIQCFY